MTNRLLIILLLHIAITSQSCLLENGMSSVYLSVFEDLEPGKSIGSLPFVGSTEGESPEISLRVVKGEDVVELDNSTKSLRLKKQLDRDEGMGKFEAVVECKSPTVDADFNQLNISVFVTVKDVNDNAPAFDADGYNITIHEELPIGTIVFADFEATDRDQPGPNSFIQYSIVPGPFSDLLEIADPYRPVVTVKNRIDFESIKTFSVEIEARDQGEPSLAAKVALNVTVLDTDDLNPYFEHEYYTARRIQDGELVVEPSRIRAIDGDSLNSKISYKLTGELSPSFSIDTEGRIRVRSNPPPSQAILIIHALESSNEDRNATSILQVNLKESIQFEHQAYSVKTHTSEPVGALLVNVKAFSTMKSSSPLTYSMEGNSDRLSIDSSGDVTIGKELEEGVLRLNVTATDEIEDETTSVPLTVFVNGGRTCPESIEFEQSEYSLQMGSLPLLGMIKVRGDETPNYKLMNLNGDFLVNPDGSVRVRPGARPACSACELIVMATTKEGAISVVKISVKTPHYESLSTSSYLTVFNLCALTILFSLVLVVVCKKVNYTLKRHKRTDICWMNSSTDTGVTITGTLPTPSRYVVSSDTSSKERIESTKSPAPKRAQGAHLVPVTVSNQDGAPTVYF